MKTIFEKAYITEKQCEAAIAKAFGADAINYVAAKGEDRKFRCVEIPAVAPKSEEAACNEALMHEPKQNVSLAEALAESGEQLGDLLEDGHKRACKEGERVPGFIDCPHCHVHLSNGVITDGDYANDERISLKDHLYECMGCGSEFGPLLAEIQAEKVANATMGGPRAKLQFSTIKSPVKRVWHIADSMPKAARKDVIAECVAQGVASGTARTQYQAWFKASQECERMDIRKPYEKA